MKILTYTNKVMNEPSLFIKRKITALFEYIYLNVTDCKTDHEVHQHYRGQHDKHEEYYSTGSNQTEFLHV